MTTTPLDRVMNELRRAAAKDLCPELSIAVSSTSAHRTTWTSVRGTGAVEEVTITSTSASEPWQAPTPVPKGWVDRVSFAELARDLLNANFATLKLPPGGAPPSPMVPPVDIEVRFGEDRVAVSMPASEVDRAPAFQRLIKRVCDVTGAAKPERPKIERDDEARPIARRLVTELATRNAARLADARRDGIDPRLALNDEIGAAWATFSAQVAPALGAQFGAAIADVLVASRPAEAMTRVEVILQHTLMRYDDGFGAHVSSGDRPKRWYLRLPTAWLDVPRVRDRIDAALRTIFREANARFQAAEPSDINYLAVTSFEHRCLWPEEVEARLWEHMATGWELSICWEARADGSVTALSPRDF